MTGTNLLALWCEECERAPGWLSIPLKAKGLRFDEAALMRIGEAIEAVAEVSAGPQAARPEGAIAGDQLPMAPVCSPCAASEDGRCCGTGECWTCPLSAEKLHDFQARTAVWMRACFGAEVSLDRTERSHRFIEEALELVQAAGCTSIEAHQLVDYVFGRPVGELPQEVGGVMVTLAALCQAHDVDMHAAGETELARVWTKIDVIRAKHAAKPKYSPLPGASTTTPAAPPITDRQRAEALVVADWANRRTDSLDGWINELLTLREHHELRGIPAFARQAMLTIAHGLADHRPAIAPPAPFIHDATERDVICKRMRRVARAAGVENAMPEDDVLYALISPMLGTIAAALERAAARPPLPGQVNQITEAEQMATRSFARESILAAFNAASATLDSDDQVKAGRMLTAALTAIDAALEVAAGQPAERARAEPMRLLAPQPAPARDVVPGKVQCAKCGFSLQRVNLYMLSGTTGAGGEQTEPCPNDGTPLLPVTWEQEAREAMKMAEQEFDRAHALEAAGAELVACKDLKDEESRLRQRRDVAISRDREATAAVDAMRDDYNRRKPLAWAAMRALLPKIDHT